MSWLRIITSTARLNAPTSNSSSLRKNLIKLMDARLHAELSRCMYSEHGFDALIRPVFGQVCHALIMVSYCNPGSPHTHVASAIWRRISRALYVSAGSL